MAPKACAVKDGKVSAGNARLNVAPSRTKTHCHTLIVREPWDRYNIVVRYREKPQLFCLFQASPAESGQKHLDLRGLIGYILQPPGTVSWLAYVWLNMLLIYLIYLKYDNFTGENDDWSEINRIFLDKGAECQRWIAKPLPIASQVGASVVEPDGRLQKCRWRVRDGEGCVSLVWEDSWCFGGMGAKGPSTVIKLGHVYNLLGFGGSSNLYEIWTAWDCYLSWSSLKILKRFCDRPLSANLGSIESSVYMCYVLAKYVLTHLLTSFFWRLA